MGIGHRVGQRGFGAGESGNGYLQSLPWQLLHEVNEALIFTTQQIARWHHHIVKEQLAGVLGFQAGLFQGLAFGKPSQMGVHQQQARAFGTRIGLGFGHHNHKVRQVTVGDESLGAVQTVMIAF